MKDLFLVIAILFAGTSFLCAQCDTIPVLADTSEFKSMLGRHDGTLIDVRTPQEWETGYIEGAVNIDFRSSGFGARISKLDTTGIYYVYCEVGGRSKLAADYMLAHGFCHVVVLQGGIRQWKAAGYELIIPTIKNKR